MLPSVSPVIILVVCSSHGSSPCQDMYAGTESVLLESESERETLDRTVQWKQPCGGHCLRLGRRTKANKRGVGREKGGEGGSVSFEPLVG